MGGYTNPLKHVRVAAPCPADWDRMRGDERVRFCDQCSLNVYNLSGMTRRQAEALLTGAEGRLCVRFYRRADGTILTQNCPVGFRALKRRVTKAANAALSAVFGFLAGLGLTAGFGKLETLNEMNLLPRERVMGSIAINRPAPTLPAVMGDIPLPREQLTVGRLVRVKRNPKPVQRRARG
jgi:hypothetical protein